MNIHVSNALAKRLDDLAAASGRPASELMEDALTAYLDEVSAVRTMLGQRYDDLISGRVESIDGAKAADMIRARATSRQPSKA